MRTLSGGIASGGKRRTHLIHPRVRNLQSARHRVCFVKVSTDRSYARLRSTGVEWTRNLFSRSGTSWRRSAPLASRMTRPRWRLPAGLRALAGTTKGMDLQRRCRCSRWAPEPTAGEIVIDDADLAAGRADRGGARALPRGIASPVPRRSGGSPCGREDPDSAAAAAPAAPATPPLPPGRQGSQPRPAERTQDDLRTSPRPIWGPRAPPDARLAQKALVKDVPERRDRIAGTGRVVTSCARVAATASRRKRGARSRAMACTSL